MFFGAYREEHKQLPGERGRLFYVSHADQVMDDYRSTDIVTWEPWEDRRPTPQFVKAIESAKPMLRFGHEFNGDWYPWAGNPDRYEAGWYTFYDEFSRSVPRVWSPNVNYPGAIPIVAYWPGDDAVDVVAIDGYGRKENNYPMPRELFMPTIEEVRRFTDKPIIVGETACGNPALKERFVKELADLPVEGVVWFDTAKEEQWQLHGASLKAWRKMLKTGAKAPERR